VRPSPGWASEDDVLAPFCGDVVSGEGDDLIYGAIFAHEHPLLDGGPGFDIAAWPSGGNHLEADLEAGLATPVYADGSTAS
jgi:hypothetical protein